MKRIKKIEIFRHVVSVLHQNEKEAANSIARMNKIKQQGFVPSHTIPSIRKKRVIGFRQT